MGGGRGKGGRRGGGPGRGGLEEEEEGARCGYEGPVTVTRGPSFSLSEAYEPILMNRVREQKARARAIRNAFALRATTRFMRFGSCGTSIQKPRT